MNVADLTPAARRVVFAVFAVALLALAFFAARGSEQDRPETPPAAANPAETGDTVVVGPSASLDSTSSTDAAEMPDLPVDATTVRSTKALAVKFAQAYTTYSYTQNDEAVAASLADMLDTGANLDLTGAVPTGTFKATLVQNKHTATSRATVTAINTVSKNLIAYEVEVTVTTTSAGKSATATTAYLVTLTREAGWGINDFHPVDTDLGSHGND